YADVLAALHEQHGPLTSGIGDAIAIGGPADAGTADDLALMQPLDEVDGRLDDRELQPEATGNLDPGELARVVQQLQEQLNDQIKGEPGRLERHRCARMKRSRSIHYVSRVVSQYVRGHR